MADYYYLKVQTENVRAFVRLNGIPLVSDPLAGGMRKMEMANRWIQPNTNNLNATLLWPTDRDFQPGKARCTATLFLADPRSSSPQPGQVLASLVWPAPQTPELYPAVLEREFQVPLAPPSLLWKQATAFNELTSGDHQNIIMCVERLRRAILAADIEEAYQACRYRFIDEGMAEYRNAARIREVVLQQYKWMIDQGPLQSEPLTPEDAVFLPLAKNRLVQVQRKNGERPVVLGGKEAAAVFSIDVFCAIIDGKWSIVR